MSAFQALKSRRDDITIEKLINNCRNPERVILVFVNMKFFRTVVVDTAHGGRPGWYTPSTGENFKCSVFPGKNVNVFMLVEFIFLSKKAITVL